MNRDVSRAKTDRTLGAFLSFADGNDEKDQCEKPLSHLTVAIKDNFVTKKLPTTCGSKILEDYQSPFDATVVERLKKAGATLVGKTNMDEFAFGSSGEYSGFYPTKNPWDMQRVPGGSSSGSAVAVASGMADVAIGSDTGGSVRQPAALTGIIGFKPTYGRLSRFGLVAFSSSLDTPGIFAQNIDDCEAVFQATAGPDSKDLTLKADVPTLPTGLKQWPLDRYVVGWHSDEQLADKEPSCEMVKGLFESRLVLEKANARFVEVPSIDMDTALASYQVISTAEASSNLARFDGKIFGQRTHSDSFDQMVSHTRTELFGPEVKRRILQGANNLREGYRQKLYAKAQGARQRITADYLRIFQKGVDVLLTIVSFEQAFPLGSKTDNPKDMYACDRPTVGPSLAGLPALSVPCGLSSQGLPLAIQVIGVPFSDERVLAFGKRFLEQKPFTSRPPLFVGGR